MDESSSYVRYLPPALWEDDETADPATGRPTFLARSLRIFEKILTGIDDGIPLVVARGGVARPTPPIEATIDRLHTLFDPRLTPAPMLDYLASWVGLELRPDWDESQRRALIARSSAIFKRRWLKAGMYTFLDIYASSEFRPRITIDDGEALFRVDLASANPTPVAIGFSRLVAAPGRTPMPFLVHPSAVACSPSAVDPFYLVADDGRADDEANRRPALWKLSTAGELLDWATVGAGGGTAAPAPRPVNEADFLTPPPAAPLRRPVAVAVDAAGRFLVLDGGDLTDAQPDAALHRYRPGAGGGYERETIARDAALQAVIPVDMAYDGDRHLFILDRGTSRPNDAQPRLVFVPLKADGTADGPATVADLRGIAEPTALALDGPGRLVVADAGAQSVPEGTPLPYPAAVRAALAGDLVRFDFDPADASHPLDGASVLGPLRANPDSPLAARPLIYPTGVAVVPGAAGVYVVCDLGLKDGRLTDPDTGVADELNRTMAEPARLVRIDVAARTVVALAPGPRLVSPTRVAVDPTGAAVVADRGDPLGAPDWRIEPHAFGVSVFFSGERPTAPADRSRLLNGVDAVIEPERPAHTTKILRF